MRTSSISALLFLACSASTAAAAQRVPDNTPPPEARSHGGMPSVDAVRASGAITIDGITNEAAWAQAAPASDFTQMDPQEGAPASQRTEVRVLYDDAALYVSARLHDSRPLSAPLGRRDMTAHNSDWFALLLDSYHDHRSAFRFSVNPAGVRSDALVTENGEDPSWDAVWDAAVRVDSAGWTVEYRIPLGQLRFSAAPEQTWGIQFRRVTQSRGETSVLAFTPRSQRGGVSAFGHLRGLSRLASGNRTELRPYSLVRASRTDPGSNPFRGREEQSVAVGVDLKYRPTSDLTLDATRTRTSARWRRTRRR